MYSRIAGVRVRCRLYDDTHVRPRTPQGRIFHLESHIHTSLRVRPRALATRDDATRLPSRTRVCRTGHNVRVERHRDAREDNLIRCARGVGAYGVVVFTRRARPSSILRRIRTFRRMVVGGDHHLDWNGRRARPPRRVRVGGTGGCRDRYTLAERCATLGSRVPKKRRRGLVGDGFHFV